MTFDAVLDVLTVILVIAGALLSLLAGIGLMRFSDLLSRMHAGTKPQVLGLICVMLAVAIRNPGFAAVSSIVLVVGFQMLTVPISAHMVGRAGYRAAHVDNGRLMVDELSGAIDEVEAEHEAEAEAEAGGGAEAGADADRRPS